MQKNKGPFGFLNGVLVGVIIGFGIAYLLGTKRGKEVTESLKDEGLSLLSDFDDLLDELAGTDGVAATPEVTAAPQHIEEPVLPKEEPAQSPQTFSTVEALSQEVAKVPESIAVEEKPADHAMNEFTDIQTRNNFMTVQVEQVVVQPAPPPHIERIQTQGRRFFRGIPKR